jgi:hypothetical protein
MDKRSKSDNSSEDTLDMGPMLLQNDQDCRENWQFLDALHRLKETLPPISEAIRECCYFP